MHPDAQDSISMTPPQVTARLQICICKERRSQITTHPPLPRTLRRPGVQLKGIPPQHSRR